MLGWGFFVCFYLFVCWLGLCSFLRVFVVVLFWAGLGKGFSSGAEGRCCHDSIVSPFFTGMLTLAFHIIFPQKATLLLCSGFLLITFYDFFNLIQF